VGAIINRIGQAPPTAILLSLCGRLAQRWRDNQSYRTSSANGNSFEPVRAARPTVGAIINRIGQAPPTAILLSLCGRLAQRWRDNQSYRTSSANGNSFEPVRAARPTVGAIINRIGQAPPTAILLSRGAAVSWLVFFIAKNSVFFCKKALFHLVSRRFRAWFPACFLAVSGAEFYLFPSCFSLRSFQNLALF
jgi:hypothetical protein